MNDARIRIITIALVTALAVIGALTLTAAAYPPQSAAVTAPMSPEGPDGQIIIPPEPAPDEEKEDLGVDPPGSFPQIVPSLTSLTAWSPIGPAPIVNGNNPGSRPTSGRIGGAAAHPTDPNILYIASVGGGIWKSINASAGAGATWTPLTDSQATLWGYCVAVSQSDPNTIYAGTGEPTNSISSFYGRGVLKSTDAGATWTLMGNSVFERRSISRVVIHPTDPNTVYVTTANGVNSLAQNRGVWKTTDGGANWTNTTVPGLTAAQFNSNYSDLLMHPTDPNTLYCAIGSASGNAKDGVYKTIDAGANWAVAGNHPFGSVLGRITIAICRSNPLVLYSIIESPSTSGLYKMFKTIDGAVTWTEITGVPNFMGGQGWYDQCIGVDPSNPDIVYVGGQSGVNGLLKSENGGTSWTSITTGSDGHGPHVDHHYMTFDSNGKLLLTNDGGVWRLDNPTLGSLIWTDLNGNLQLTQFMGIAMHPTDPNLAYGGSQDNGSEKYTGVLGWTAIRGGDGGNFRVDPVTPTRMYHTFFYLPNQSPSFFERSTDGGTNWVTKVTGINNADAGNFYVHFILDPSNPNRLLLGTNRVYESTNNADSWAAISAPGTNGWTSSSAVDAIAVAKTDGNTIYATSAGTIQITFDHGANWAQRNSGTSGDHFRDILADPTDNMTAYVVRDRFGANGHVFRTTNGGVSWTNISGNLPDIPLNSIELAPNNPGQADDAIYVGADTGVYRSKDGGATWTVWATGMPNVAVFDLEINQNLGLLMAGTHGRGAFQIQLPTSPSIAALSNASTVCGSLYTGPTPSATGTTPLTWSLVAGPGGMTIDSGTGVVSWPNPIPSLTAYTVSIKAENDGGGFDTKSYLLKVKPGDFNGDGLADDADLGPFVSCLLDPPNCSLSCAADVNNDTIIDGLDASAWVTSSLTP